MYMLEVTVIMVAGTVVEKQAMALSMVVVHQIFA